MKEELIIEPISKRNFDDFLSLIGKLAEYEELTPPDEGAKKRLREHGLSEHPMYEAYVGKRQGAYVGYIIFFMAYSSILGKPTLYLEDIFVLKEQRRKGVGQQFFKFIVNQAKKRGCGRIEWHVLDWNQSGIRFYEKYKAIPMPHWVLFRLTNNQFNDLL
jgi:GNAT superfamily N-acetyltransferase